MGNRILFAEDDVLVRSLIGELLREEGFAVFEVESGDAAASVLEGESFDILLTDVRMPGRMDGLDLAAHARQRSPALPVVVMSGYAEQLGARTRALGDRVALLHKPCRLEELVTALRNVDLPAPFAICSMEHTPPPTMALCAA